MIYIHIPYCVSHCTYCAFYSELLRPCAQGSDARYAVPPEFVDTLCREMEAEREEFSASAPPTLYIGGGTPSLLSFGQLERIIRTASSCFGAFDEMTVEVNPEDIVKKGKDYLSRMREIGVNRISMGAQSFDDDVLKRMGRRHRAVQTVEAFNLLKEEGFHNVSLDFIFGFSPDSETDGIMSGLNSLPSLPQHISCYQLGVEEGSGLEKMLDRGLWTLPDDDECASRYSEICSILNALGYEHYEVSNWAKPGFRSRHNSAYWVREPYLGFGPGAHSLLCKEGACIRRWNKADLKSWLSQGSDFSQVREQEILTDEQKRVEDLMLGLRTMEGVPGNMIGVDIVSFNSAYGHDVLEEGGGRLRIAEDSWFISDNIIEELI